MVDAQGSLTGLTPGVRVRPAGCRQAECAVTWDGEMPLEMDQMVVEFEIKEGVTWSDGTPVTAADSVFGFQAASDPDAPGLHWAEERTASYSTVDIRTVQWVGKPGFSSAQLESFFWTPLPSHLFTDSARWSELLTDLQLTQTPPSYGPFVVGAWESDAIQLVPNPYYYQSDKGLTLLDAITYRAIEPNRVQAWEALQTGECDLLDSSFGFENDPGLLNEIMADARFKVQVGTTGAWTQLVFGIQPFAYDDGYSPAMGDRPDLLRDVRTRQALAACLDREGWFETRLSGLDRPWTSFVPPELSQLSDDVLLKFDPSLAKQWLSEAGWLDHDGDPQTMLQAGSVTGVPVGTPLSLELTVSDSVFHQDLANLIQESFAVCGVGVQVVSLPVGEIFAPGPDGVLFGRQFDLALISWMPAPELDCSYYLSRQIPSADNQWIGTNIAGFSESTYDDACVTANLALPTEHQAEMARAEEVFISYLPAVPLFASPDINILPIDPCKGNDVTHPGNFFANIAQFAGDKNCP